MFMACGEEVAEYHAGIVYDLLPDMRDDRSITSPAMAVATWRRRGAARPHPAMNGG
jgi:hypothetical protein